ncbi:hypothetical protein SAMN04489859_102010 [Paracoccus alcaliphilus]|uniref:Uncharacterized protein n=1 Tax=Paracoccus alcaliphilus TaxID=34002 RepID=A0A1H8K320_9RHOB|nr:PLxRFG domain-containing protein [Paracoccus alcaliphilus]WCR17506.1 PLxRFG domain-containing protein [Paracoccus alcaliphilus]SEN87057.1 hypothetical protein SAMN04489859_102010 [Paracoccus alcaliphilus]
MAQDTSGNSPLNSALMKLGALPDQPQQNPKDQFDAIARETSVPANVLMALDGGRSDTNAARNNAQSIASAMERGAKLEDAVSSLTGDPAAARSVMDRSYQIADELYPMPEQPERKPGLLTDVTDVGKAFGAGAVRAAGGAVQMAGVAVDDTLRNAVRDELEAAGGDPNTVQGESYIRSGSRRANDAIGGASEAITESMSERGQEAMRNTQPGGDLLSPSTWTMGEDPSVRGAVLQAAQGIGSMAPLVAAPNPVTAAALGSLMAGGEGADAGRQFVLDAAKIADEDGRPIIEKMPGYQDLIAQGMSADDAAQELARMAESESGFRQSIIGAVGGAATNRIMRSADGWLGAGGRLARAGKKGAAGFIEEGTQEALEGVASQSGIAAATGADVDVTEDSFGNFVLGGLAGGGMGAGMGAMRGGGDERTPTDPSDATGADGADGETATGLIPTDPDGGGAGPGHLPAMGAIDGEVLPPMQGIRRAPDGQIEPEAIEGEWTEQGGGVPSLMGLPAPEYTGIEGSEAGMAAVPAAETPLSDAAGAAAPPSFGALPAPAGPIEQAAQSIIEDTSESATEVQSSFPEYKPGSSLRLGNASTGDIHDAVFMGETPEGNARVRVSGQQIDLTPQKFDMVRDNVARIEAAQEAPGNVEPAATDDRAGTDMRGPVRVSDGLAPGGEGTAPGGPVEPQGGSEPETLDGRGAASDQEGQQAGQDGLGRVDVADGTGEPRDPLNEALTAPPQTGQDPQHMQGGEALTTPETGQPSTTPVDPADWAWRGRKINARNRNAATSDYLAPGNIIEGYGGERQRVVSYDPQSRAVTVEPVVQEGSEWISVGEQRTHGTMPEDRALVRGPVARTADPISIAAAQADPEPTEAQKESGNYRKGHARWNGLDLSIENAKGSERRGTGPDGTEWSVTMPAHYGYFRGTEGADGDHVDFYMGDVPESDYVLIVDQVDADTGKFDEHKVIVGTTARGAALSLYRDGFSDGKGDARIGAITETTTDGMKSWLQGGQMRRPAAGRLDFPFKRRAHQQQTPAPQSDALDGEIITPESEAEARAAAAESVGVELTDPPTPQRAPWWQDAPDDVRQAIMEEAGPSAARAARRGLVWDKIPVKARRALTDAYGRLYRAGTITNAGTIENPRPALAIPAQDSQRPRFGDPDPSPATEPASTAPEQSAPVRTPQRRPFIKYVGDRFGGINPTGSMAAELRHRGVNARTAPGLFRRSGAKDLDNIVASEHPDLIGTINVDQETGYFEPGSIIEAISEEVAGNAQPIGEQAEVQAEARDRERAEQAERTGDGESGYSVGDNAGAADRAVPDREADIRTDDERRGDIARAVDAEIERLGLDEALTVSERASIVDEVDDTSADIWDTIYDFIVRSDANAVRESAGDGSATSEGTGVPFGDERDGSQSELNAGETGGSGTPGNDIESVERGEGNDADSAADSGRLTPDAEPDTDSRIADRRAVLRETASDEATDPVLQELLGQQATDPQVGETTPETFANWKRSVPSTGRARGWTVFDDAVSGGWVLMASDRMISGFPTEADARAWASDNPEATFGREESGRAATASPAVNTEAGALAAFDAAGMAPGKDPATRVLDGERRDRAGRWVVRQIGDKFHASRVTDQVGTIAVPTRKIGVYDAPDAAIAALRADGAPLSGDTAVTEEAGADGLPQTILPGMEGSEEQARSALTAQQRAEIEARQKQSRIGRLDGNSGDAGPLFDTQQDMFSSRQTAAPASAAPTPSPAEEAPSTPATPDRIEDFGEKIEGARKDTWMAYADRMQDAATVDIAAEPLSKSWPAPVYVKLIDAGVEPWKVGFIRAARDSIPTKPQKSYRLSSWVKAVTELRGLAQDIMDGKIDQRHLDDALKEGGRSLRDIQGQMKLYDAVGHGKSLKGMSFGEVAYSMLSGVRYDTPKGFWEVSQKVRATAFSNMPRTIARAESEAEALDAFKKAYGTLGQQKEKASTGRKWLVYRHNGGEYFTVGTKIGSTYIQLRRVGDVKEARRIISDEADLLQEQFDKMREIPADRRTENAPRVGFDHRGGLDVTPEQFEDQFGFRGVQFGNWVEGGRRQKDLNDAFDALMDLAGVLDIPPRAISLNGTLGLAFGARGRGGVSPAAAHFEPGQVVINLTKMNGAGSLAHEWFHAMDNYFQRQRTDGKPGSYITDSRYPESPVTGVRPEVMDAFVVVRQAIGKTKLKERSENIDKLRHKAYWGTGVELHARAFESYVIAKLQDQSIANDYLANIVEGTVWQIHAEMSGLGDSYPYLKPDEVETVRPAFDALFEAIQTRETDSGVELYQRDMAEPVAQVKSFETIKGATLPERQRAAINWFRDNLVGQTIENKQTGFQISFNMSGAKETVQRTGDDILALIPTLPDILANADYQGSEPDRKGRPSIKAVHRFSAPVEVDGRVERVFAIVRETTSGKFHYRLAKDNVGARPQGPAVNLKSQRDQVFAPALDGDPDTINIEIESDSGNASIAPAALRDIAALVRSIVAHHGLDRSISPRVVRNLLSASGARILGTYRAGEINVNAGAADPAHVVRHEIIHALRDANLWGKDYGLFSQQEWQALARAARANRAVREAVEKAYPDLTTAAQTEEMIAELYADWATGRAANPPGALGRAFDRIRSFFNAMAAALRGEGFQDAASIMERIANGEIGGRGPDGPGSGSRPEPAKEQRNLSALKEALFRSKGKSLGMIGKDGWTGAKDLMSNLLTDAMGRNARFNVLSLVPGRALFTELAKNIPAAQDYIGLKERMDADRNKWQARAAEMVDKWTAAARRSPTANMGLMDLMHDSTLAGIDPSKDGSWRRPVDDQARDMLKGKPSPAQNEWARITLNEAQEREAEWNRLREMYDALPPTFQELYGEIRDEYTAMADAMDAALMDNIRASAKMVVRKADREHRKELQRIKDEGLTGEARAVAIEKANKKRTNAHARAATGQGARLKQMRQIFEDNRLSGPYFPLSRFGNYFVTIRDGDGKVVSFSRFEKAAQQQAFMEQARKDGLGKVDGGVLGGDVNLREQVDPRFLADVEELLAESGASKELMDQVWQRWLETLPDQSVRTNKIHRKGRAGFNKDAIRAFSSAMFHGAHQQARLRFGAEMEDTLEVAEEQAKSEPDPNRAGFVVREMKQRHAFTMQPTNNPLVTMATSAAFVWYLGMSPAAAAVNVSQTTVVGVPLMATRFRKAGVGGSIKALTAASADFMRGKGKVSKRVGGMPVWTDQWSVDNAPNLTADERRAMQQGYDRGVIDKTQANDLAAVADSGVEYSGRRERVMRVIGFMFHHAERFNREVTYLASYRLARGEGLSHDAAISSAASMTWKVHFDYQNTSKPRAMTGDAAKILTVFRNFQVNMLFRMFRDTHQALHGADAETRREARNQLAGVTLSMMSHAGIRGVWGYALLTGLLSLFFPGADDSDDIDAWLQDALLIEGDGLGVAAWNWTMGLALNGAPGHALGINLTNRIGMPDLWFQSSQRDLEGQDLWHYYLEQIAGPAVGIVGSMVSGAATLGEGHVMRGMEKMVPTFARNTIKTTRYATEGVNTFYGDPLVEDVSPWQLLMQLQGFTPAEVAERYQINNRLRNKQSRIEKRRKDIVREIGDAVRKGDEIPDSAVEKMRRFNQDIPEWAITADSIRQSVRARQRASDRNELGVALNPRLNRPLRESQPPSFYGG